MNMRIFLAAIMAALCLSAKAGIVSSNLLTLATVNNATNIGSAVKMGNVTLPVTTFSIQSLNTGGTNTVAGCYIYAGLSTNLTNMTLIATVATTNDTILSYVLSSNQMPIYFSLTAFNRTNTAVQIGAQAVQVR